MILSIMIKSRISARNSHAPNRVELFYASPFPAVVAVDTPTSVGEVLRSDCFHCVKRSPTVLSLAGARAGVAVVRIQQLVL